MAEVVSAVLRPYGYATTSVRGPAVHLGERTTNAIALVTHELATNASKYGALSVERGKVAVDWETQAGVVTIRWIESGGPLLIGPPEKLGFGSKLVDSTVAGHGGTISYDWKPTGVEVTMTLPESALAT